MGNAAAPEHEVLFARLPPGLRDRVDARCAEVGLSRNQWLIRVLEWALSQPIKETTVSTVERV